MLLVFATMATLNVDFKPNALCKAPTPHGICSTMAKLALLVANDVLGVKKAPQSLASLFGPGRSVERGAFDKGVKGAYPFLFA